MEKKFARGQVWINPDEELMLVTSVIAKFGGTKVYYITEAGEIGSFYSSEKAITNNIEKVTSP